MAGKNKKAFDPKAPTTVKAPEKPLAPQTVKLDPNKRIVDARVDIIALIKTFDPIKKNLEAGVKTSLVEAGAKWADGNDSEAQMKQGGTGNEVDVWKAIKWFMKDRKCTLEVAIKKLMPAMGMGLKDLGDIIGKANLPGVCNETPAKAASMEVGMKGDKEVPFSEAIDRLNEARNLHPEMFIVPKKGEEQAIALGVEAKDAAASTTGTVEKAAETTPA